MKIILPFFIEPIVHIFNDSINNSKFPQIWNAIRIKPIKKIPTPKLPPDTRPITINSIFTKIIIRILNNQLKTFIDDNNLLCQFHLGFRNDHSCTSALIKVSDDINQSLQKNEITILVLLDIEAAYPSVSHELIFHTLKNMGMQSK